MEEEAKRDWAAGRGGSERREPFAATVAAYIVIVGLALLVVCWLIDGRPLGTRRGLRSIRPRPDPAHPLDCDPHPDARRRIVHRREAHIGTKVDAGEFL